MSKYKLIRFGIVEIQYPKYEAPPLRLSHKIS